MATVIITGVEKKGMIINLLTDRPRPITYDMKNHQFTSYTGRPVKAFPRNTALGTNNLAERCMIAAVSRATNESCELVEKVEMYWNEPELLKRASTISDLPAPPKGYIKWLKEYNKLPSSETLKEYNMYKKSLNLLEDDRQTLKMLTSGYNAPYNWTDNFINFYMTMRPSERKKFNRILKISLTTCIWDLSFVLRLFVSIIITMPTIWADYVDDNRNFVHNNDLLQKVLDEHKGQMIIEKENKIRAIETLSNEKYVVVVPQTLKDFTDEGILQNNCVGYYYHDSILRGQNLIYFIRRRKNPNHSYITNRFNIKEKHTVESRKVNNSPNNDHEAWTLIKQIDEMINKLLSE